MGRVVCRSWTRPYSGGYLMSTLEKQSGKKSGRRVLTRPGASWAPAFGRWVAEMRGDESLEDIAMKIRPYVEQTGLKVDRSSLMKLESGRLPSWPMMAALGIVFDVPFQVVIDQLVSAIDFPGREKLLPSRRDGSRTGGTPSSEVTHGNAPTASAFSDLTLRCRQCEKTLEAYRGSFAKITRIAIAHVGPNLLADLSDSTTTAPRRAESAGAGRHRKLRAVPAKSNR